MDRIDLLAIIGVLLVAAGAALLSIPAGLIVLGLACVIWSILAGRSSAAPANQATKKAK